MIGLVVWALDVLCTFNESFWIFFFADTLFEKRFMAEPKGWKRGIQPGICIAATMLLVLLMNQVELTSIYTMIAGMLSCLLAVFIFWKTAFLESLSLVGGYFMVHMVRDVIEITVMGWIGGDDLIERCCYHIGVERFWILVIGGIDWFLICFGISLLIKKYIHVIRNPRFIVVIIVCGVFGSNYFYYQVLSSFQLQTVFGWYVFVSVLTVAAFIWLYRNRMQRIALENKMLNYQNQLLEQKYRQVNENYVSNAKTYHDLRHHLNSLYQMMEEGRGEDAKRYIQNLEQPIRQSAMVTWTGHSLLDAILNVKRDEAGEKGVNMSIDTRMLENISRMKEQDVCALFANLIENAVEAATREISVVIREKHNMIYVEVKNDCKKMPVIKKDGSIQSTKENPREHGWGMISINEVVRRYQGTIDYGEEAGFFVTKIFLEC